MQSAAFNTCMYQVHVIHIGTLMTLTQYTTIEVIKLPQECFQGINYREYTIRFQSNSLCME